MVTIERTGGQWINRFRAMASPCEVLVDTPDRALAERLGRLARREVTRIERAFSRYRTDNIVHRINTSQGRPVRVDAETAALLDFAQTCYEVSGGRFDVTSGVLRRVWRFDGSSVSPDESRIRDALALVGWPRVGWEPPTLLLPPGMEIDFGGIGKEYAVDRTLALLVEQTSHAVLVNLGGDLAVSGPRAGGEAWTVGIEDPAAAGDAVRRIRIERGAIATSGDARRYVTIDGVRHSHILDPTTGWPVTGAPRSVTVLADTCTEAGLHATLAMLHGSEAESYLESEGLRAWCVREP